MKNTNYIVIQGWMINELKLSGNDLLLFALINGFSQDGNSTYSGSLFYISELLNLSKPTAIKTIKALLERDLIVKITKTNSKNQYSISGSILSKYYGIEKPDDAGEKSGLGSKEILLGSKESLLVGSKEILPLPIYIYNKKNIIKKGFIRTKEKSKIKKQNLPSIYNQFDFFQKEFKDIWLSEFLPLKIKKKGSTTERALLSQLNKIKEFSNNNYETALSILEKSVNSGWVDFYPINNGSGSGSGKRIGTRTISGKSLKYTCTNSNVSSTEKLIKRI